MNPKQQYHLFASTVDLPLFFQPHWLDASQFNWDVVFAESDAYSAYWVYHYEQKSGLRFIRNAHLTPYTGLCFVKQSDDVAVNQKLVDALLAQLPTFDVLELDLLPSIQTQFTFDTMKVSMRRTNIIHMNEMSEVYNQFKPSLKRQIRKADKTLHIIEADNIRLFYKLHSLTFRKQQKEPAITPDVYQSYWDCCKQANCGRMFFIQDALQRPLASVILAYDNTTAYYLAGGSDAEFYQMGGMSGLMWYAIRESFRMNKQWFDFEGSMLPNIDRFFKNFSPEEIQYIHLEQINSLMYKMYHLLKK